MSRKEKQWYEDPFFSSQPICQELKDEINAETKGGVSISTISVTIAEEKSTRIRQLVLLKEKQKRYCVEIRRIAEKAIILVEVIDSENRHGSKLLKQRVEKKDVNSFNEQFNKIFKKHKVDYSDLDFVILPKKYTKLENDSEVKAEEKPEEVGIQKITINDIKAKRQKTHAMPLGQDLNRPLCEITFRSTLDKKDEDESIVWQSPKYKTYCSKYKLKRFDEERYKNIIKEINLLRLKAGSKVLLPSRHLQEYAEGLSVQSMMRNPEDLILDSEEVIEKSKAFTIRTSTTSGKSLNIMDSLINLYKQEDFIKSTPSNYCGIGITQRKDEFCAVLILGVLRDKDPAALTMLSKKDCERVSEMVNRLRKKAGVRPLKYNHVIAERQEKSFRQIVSGALSEDTSEYLMMAMDVVHDYSFGTFTFSVRVDKGEDAASVIFGKAKKLYAEKLTTPNEDIIGLTALGNEFGYYTCMFCLEHYVAD